MNLINISVDIKGVKESKDMILYQKIYSTPDGIVNHWSTTHDSEYRLEFIIDEKDISVNPSKIVKDLSIETDEWELADRMMLKLYEKGIFQLVKIY